ncbi:MAG: acyl-CoA thioesterase [Planctomycetota bacterium]|jgi:acyl-CoA thioester hydrolase|nr:acyl-CoA thioesterase [Planctomycetota bacterium]
MPRTHSFSYRVSYGDTDRMDRVYYANYLEICERARGELLREAGFPYRGIETGGWFFPVRSCQARYFGYAVYDDLLLCRTRITRLRHATLAFTTDIFRDGSPKPLVSATVELACVRMDGRPDVIPPELRTAIAPYVEE